MIEIRHKKTGEVLARVSDDTLQGADLRGLDLAGAEPGPPLHEPRGGAGGPTTAQNAWANTYCCNSP
jgi:hypothetical protein